MAKGSQPMNHIVQRPVKWSARVGIVGKAAAYWLSKRTDRDARESSDGVYEIDPVCAKMVPPKRIGDDPDDVHLPSSRVSVQSRRS